VAQFTLWYAKSKKKDEGRIEEQKSIDIGPLMSSSQESHIKIRGSQKIH